MRITTKCPNCGSQNEPDNTFCMVCGVRLTPESTESTPKPAPSKTMYCSANPRGHTIDNPDLGFCPVCGAVLTETVPDEPSPAFGPRTCKNGHTYYDPFLTYCPECGLPFIEESESSESETPKPEPPKPEPPKPEPPKPKPIVIPDGMYIPTDDDLKR